jgi:hypothetical protein
MQNLLTLGCILSSGKVTSTKQTRIFQTFEQDFKLRFTSHCGTLTQHESTRTKTKGTFRGSFRFDDFPFKDGRNCGSDE